MKQRLLLIFFFGLSFFNIKAQLNLQWQEVGPDNFGGKVRALIFDKRDPTRQTLYAGVMGGGVWKTTDGGAWWFYLGCGGNYAVSCMTQASDGTIYFGTGDGLIGYWSSGFSEAHSGNGIYKIDSADNVIHLNSTTPGSGSYQWQGVNRIAVDPLNSNHLLAATFQGFYTSVNHGNSWTEVVLPGIAAGQPALDVKWGSNGMVVYAAVGGGNTLVMSPNGGLTWNLVNHANNPGFPPTESRIEIAIAPSNSNIVYISIAANSPYNGSTYGVFKTDSAGNPLCSWDTIALKSPLFDPFAIQGQGWFDNAIAVCPIDSSKFYVGGVKMYAYSPQTGMYVLPQFINPVETPLTNMPQFLYVINDLNPDEMYIATESGVFKSTNIYSNAIPTITAMNYGLRAAGFFSVAATRNGNVLGVTDNEEGLLMSQGSSQSFRQIASGLGFCEASQLDTNYYFEENYYGQLRSCRNNNFYFSSCLDTNIDPLHIGNPSACGAFSQSGNALFIDPFLLHETKTAFNTSDSVSFVAGTVLAAGDVVSITSSTAATSFSYTLPVGMNAGEFITVPDPVKSRLFFSSNCGVWMKLHALNDFAKPDWYKISDTMQGTAQCFAVTSDGNTVFTGTSTGAVYRISGLNTANYNNRNMGSSMSISASAIGGNIEGIAVDPKNDSVVLVTNTVVNPNNSNRSNVYKSTDAGATWRAKQIGPLGLPAYTCVIDGHNSNNYLVGTEHGVYTSQDSGATWQQDFGAMCDVSVYRLRQIPLLDDNCLVLYAATNARGLWRSFTLTPSGCNTSVGINDNYSANQNGDFKIYPNPASLYTTIEFELPVANSIELSVFDITGRKMQSVKQFLPAGNNKLELNTSGLSPGTYLVSLMAGQAAKTKLLVVGE